MESPSPAYTTAPETPPITVEEWQHRFKVVKIVSKEPRKRGRWYCMDFNDPPHPVIDNTTIVKPTESQSLNSPLVTGPTNENYSQQSYPNNKELLLTSNVESDETVFDHLMVAVKEEVVTLKERIEELMFKISQLEFENGILRAHASPETLELLKRNQQTNPLEHKNTQLSSSSSSTSTSSTSSSLSSTNQKTQGRIYPNRPKPLKLNKN